MALTAEQQAMDFNPELQDVSRQRKLADLLMSQGMQQPQGQMISGHYVAPSWTQQINPIANILAGQAVGERADTKQMQMAQALRTRKGEALATFQELMSKPETRSQAMSYAAQQPDLQGLATELMKPRDVAEGGKVVIPGFGTEGIEIAKGNPKQTELMRDYAEAIRTGAFKGSIVDYDLMRKNATASRTSVSIQNQLPFNEQVQLEMGKDLVKEYSNLKSIPSQVQNLDKIEKLAASPAYLGSGAEAKLAITKLFNNNLGTNVNADKVANTEEMRSALFQSTMENLKKVDAQPSQEQQRIMQEAFGTIGTDPAAIPRIVKVYKDILISKAKEHNERVDETEQGPAKMKYAHSIRIKVPETAKTPTTSVFPNVDVRSIDAILNSRGVK
jgi:hypothetical protein